MEQDARIKKNEDKVDKLDDKVTTLDTRITVLEMQVGRLTSHVESEVGLARQDVNRIELRLFGEDDKKYSGRIGEINEDIAKINSKFIYINGVIGTLLVLLELYRTFK